MLLANNYLAQNQPKKYQLYNQRYIETRYEREQSELKSINTSIDSQTAENFANIRNMTLRHRLVNFTVSFAGICIAGWLLLRILKQTKQNRTLRDHISTLLN